MHEEEEEDCVASVHKLLQDLFDVSGSVIENAHRVGPAKEGRPRQMIARFHSRTTRRDIMSKAREKLQNTSYRIVDDLTAKDLDEKRRLLPLMNKLYQEKKRPGSPTVVCTLAGNRYPAKSLPNRNSKLRNKLRHYFSVSCFHLVIFLSMN